MPAFCLMFAAPSAVFCAFCPVAMLFLLPE